MTTHPSHTDAHDRNSEEKGCLRLVLAVPVTLLTLIAGYFCYLAMTIRPSGSWDDDAYAGISLSGALAVAAAGMVAAMWLAPSVRRVMGWAWLAPALLLGAVAAVRWGMNS
ncbi:hypothetical protein [Streptomyces laurentii]|uniref:hypothetical protein n=1 Tax=Streptomyces laurentii TaxID=39478 RepID=UPI00367701C8